MKSVIKLPYEGYCGNLIWIPPYLYPAEDIENGLKELQEKGYWVSEFPEGDGITFKHEGIPKENVYSDFCIAFYWMDIKLCEENEEFNYEEDILKYQFVILPVSRLEISKPILSKTICLFPAGHFRIDKIKIKFLTGLPFESQETNQLLERKEGVNLRDLITSTTNINIQVFQELPVIVFQEEIKWEVYRKLSHEEDVELIRKYSQKADGLLDLLRFHECDYNKPELLPAKAGIWHNRYSTALIYFPKYDSGFIQAREVEVKTFIKSLGMDFFYTNLITRHPLLHGELKEVGFIAKYALRLNTLIAESDNESMKFTQIMTLFEYLGNPNNYEKFQVLKGKLITCIAKNKTEYHLLSEKFKYYSETIRTKIIHNGKNLEELIVKSDERNDLFIELKNYINILISDLFEHYNIDWHDYENLRKERQRKLLM